MIKGHKPPFILREFKVEVTYRCDLNCVHCSSDAHPSNLLEMSREDCLRILEEAVEADAKEVAFSGGEPLSWPHISEATKKAAGLGLKVTVYTSGHTDDFNVKAEQLYRLGASCFIFSIFGNSESTHEQITRVAGSFSKTIDSIEFTVKKGFASELHFVPMSNNYRELRGVVELGRRLGVKVVSVLRLVPQGRALLIRRRVLTRIQNLELGRQIRTLSKQGFKVRTGSPYNFLMLSSTPECCAAIDRMIIGPDLRIYPCDAFKQVKAEELVGTLDSSSLKDNSVSKCWQSSPFLVAVRKYLTSPFGPTCDKCTNLELCLSGCLAQKVIASETFEKEIDPDCLIHITREKRNGS